MSQNKTYKTIKGIEKAVKNIKKNKFTLYFFTVDSKNIPNSNIAYTYELAKTLKDKGYNVTMLYQLENEYTEGDLFQLKQKNAAIDYNRVFTGVADWLGKPYAEIEHLNISTNEWSVAPSDFLFIPEVFSGLMFETYKHKIPCKRYVILQNYDNVTEFIPLGVEWKNYGIYDVIASTERQVERIKNVFPYIKAHILPPCISNVFRSPIKPKQLIINIVTKDKNDINRIIKPFYWKYPMYKFISFRELSNYSRDKYAEYLKDSAITVWVDRDTSFGYTPLEAMRCDSVVVGKIPDNIPEWMLDEIGILNNGLWVNNIDDIPDVLSKAIASWMQDNLPKELTGEMNKTKQKYTMEEWSINVEKLFNSIISNRIQNLEDLKNNIANTEIE